MAIRDKGAVFFVVAAALLLMLSTPALAGYCYQEQANESTACGGLATGAYALTGTNWASGRGEPYDGNWSTGDYSRSASYEYIYVNYTIPSQVDQTGLWQVLDCSSPVPTNLSIPANCAKTSPARFRMGSKLNSGSDYNAVWECYNGIGWQTLRSNGGTNCDLWEEGVWWNGSNWAPSVDSITLNSSGGANTSQENLTASVTASDPDGDNISYAWDWRLENTSIAVLNTNFDVNDSAGAGKTKDYTTWSNNLTASGSMIWNATAGWNGTGAYTNNGSAGALSVSDNDELDLGTGNLTLRARVKMDELSSYQVYVAKRDGGYGDGYSIYKGTGTSSVACSMLNATAGIATGGATLTPGVWEDIVCVIDRDDRIYLYVNGVLKANSSSLVGTTWETEDLNTSQPFVAGALSTAGTWPINGTIDMVQVYKRALSAQQVAALYDNRSGLIVRQETNKGENWSVCVTPNDGQVDGSATCSATLEVQNTCTYPGSGDWLVDAADDCTIATAVDLNGNSLRCTGSGSFTVTGAVRNWTEALAETGCDMRAAQGGTIASAPS